MSADSYTGVRGKLPLLFSVQSRDVNSMGYVDRTRVFTDNLRVVSFTEF